MPALDLIVPVLIYMFAFIISIGAHEAAHAYSAHFFGDRTPQSQGRLTLNPIAHLSLAGTALPMMAILLRLPLLFGWGKPVNVDYAQMRWNPYCRSVVAAAGSFANLCLCMIAGVAAAFITPQAITTEFLNIMVGLNAMLCIFNMLPLAPLDGATVLKNILPGSLKDLYEDYIAPYGFYIFIALLISGQIGWMTKAIDFIEASAFNFGQYMAHLL